MTVKSDFVISLDTSKAICDESFARTFLAEWLEHPLEQLRPERWGRGEPVRNPIGSTSLEHLVSEWAKVPLMFSRVSRPRMKVSLAWRRNKGLDPRPFPWGLVAWLTRSGPELTRAFFELVVRHFEPAFASVTTEEESRHKHFVREPHFVDGLQTGVAESFRGHHVLDTLPGIYWVTYIGCPLIERVGEQAITSIPCGRIERIGQGYMLIAYEDPSLIGSEEGRVAERRIVEHLGRHRFFNKGTSVGQKVADDPWGVSRH